MLLIQKTRYVFLLTKNNKEETQLQPSKLNDELAKKRKKKKKENFKHKMTKIYWSKRNEK